MGITQYGSSGKPDDLYRMQGLDVESLVQAVLDEIQKDRLIKDYGLRCQFEEL